MREVQVTVLGNVATRPELRNAGASVPAVRFRLASTIRRFDRARQCWTDGQTSFYTVWAWRALAVNVCSSVTLGEPLVVTGQLRVRDEERDGRRYVSADLLATAIGHNLACGTSAFARPARAAPASASAGAALAGRESSAPAFAVGGSPGASDGFGGTG